MSFSMPPWGGHKAQPGGNLGGGTAWLKADSPSRINPRPLLSPRCHGWGRGARLPAGLWGLSCVRSPNALKMQSNYRAEPDGGGKGQKPSVGEAVPVWGCCCYRTDSWKGACWDQELDAWRWQKWLICSVSFCFNCGHPPPLPPGAARSVPKLSGSASFLRGRRASGGIQGWQDPKARR